MWFIYDTLIFSPGEGTIVAREGWGFEARTIGVGYYVMKKLFSTGVMAKSFRTMRGWVFGGWGVFVRGDEDA